MLISPYVKINESLYVVTSWDNTASKKDLKVNVDKGDIVDLWDNMASKKGLISRRCHFVSPLYQNEPVNKVSEQNYWNIVNISQITDVLIHDQVIKEAKKRVKTWESVQHLVLCHPEFLWLK